MQVADRVLQLGSLAGVVAQRWVQAGDTRAAFYFAGVLVVKPSMSEFHRLHKELRWALRCRPRNSAAQTDPRAPSPAQHVATCVQQEAVLRLLRPQSC